MLHDGTVKDSAINTNARYSQGSIIKVTTSHLNSRFPLFYVYLKFNLVEVWFSSLNRISSWKIACLLLHQHKISLPILSIPRVVMLFHPQQNMNKDKRSETILKVLEFVSTSSRLVIRATTQFRGSFLMKLKWPLSWAGKGCYFKGSISHQSIFLLNVQVFDLGGQQ